MKSLQLLPTIIVLSFFLGSCKKEEIDTEKPGIDLSIQDAFPVNCDTLYFGETFEFKALFSDNAELGSSNAYSIDIHNNFDHHSHTTEVIECNLDPVKAPVNPYLFIESFDIPLGLSEYETNLSLTIPSGDSNGDFDDGDYHFFISLSDKEGWTTQKGLSIKLLHRE
jgi:hypothetical protein